MMARMQKPLRRVVQPFFKKAAMKKKPDESLREQIRQELKYGGLCSMCLHGERIRRGKLLAKQRRLQEQQAKDGSKKEEGRG